MNKLSVEKKIRVVSCLVEGNSLGSTVKMTGIHRTTIQKFLVEVGVTCSAYQDKTLRNLKCKRIQCDKIWSFVGCKEKDSKPDNKAEGWGDVWTWTAIDDETKLVPSWYVGDRGATSAYHFINDLKERIASRVQLKTDGHKVYLQAAEDAFGTEIDFAQLVKIYVNEISTGETKHSPPICIGVRKVNKISGDPDPQHESTSYPGRQNPTMGMSMPRFATLTNAFSKKIENHEAAIALHFMYYNFARVHQALRVTPAMAAGVSDHVWSLEEIAHLD